MDLHYKIYFKDGSEYSDLTTLFRVVDGKDLSDVIDKDTFKEYCKLARAGRTGMDVDNIDYISFWDDEGNEY